ncbi:MAG: LamG-like jellyroll fold domain-containing protein [Kiritimatiellia bacterium]|jgi:hypothetical protein|nr:LamG-like jellyroll fold domain-containing protein [Kiritimatiellia bacterium]
MNPNESPHEAQIAAFLAGDAQAADALAEACRDTPGLVDTVAGHLEVERLLRLEAALGTENDLFAREVTARLQRADGDEPFVDAVIRKLGHARPHPPWRHWGRIAAAALFAATAAGWLLRTAVRPARAVVTRQTSAVWHGAGYAPGDTVRSGALSLQEGCAEVRLANGVRLILEAPAALDLSDPQRVVLSAGTLVATVPRHAQGFTVITPSAEVVDLGTAFGVSVDARGGSELCVLEGEVKARGDRGQAFVTMTKDEACAFDPDRQMTMIRSDPGRFVRALPGRSSARPEYLHWSFDEPGATVACGGTGIQGRRYDGTLKAVGAGQGPLSQEGVFGRALYFNGRDAYVETAFPGIGGHAPRTVAFWARVPEGDIAHSGYAMIGWGLMAPGAAWQISANPYPPEGPPGRIRIGTMQGMVIGSTDLRDNRWHHIAIVMYGGDSADTATHILIYVDGKLEKTARKSIAGISTTLGHTRSQPLRFGRNLAFAHDDQPVADKFFTGWLDEIYVFDTALELRQIASLMTRNRIF